MKAQDIRYASQRNVDYTRNISRDLITKAMEMRCKSYLSSIKADLLTRTIFEVDKSRKKIRQNNEQLEDKVAQKTSSLRKMNVNLQHEVKEHQHTEDQLRKLSEAVENAGEGIFITDTEGHIEYANRAFYTSMAYDDGELIGLHPSMFKSDEQGEEFYQGLWQTILAGETWNGFMVNLKKDGTKIPVMMTIAPIFNRQHKVAAFVVTQQDMTKQRELEAQFQQAQKMEALGTLVGGIAHDFNNMLAAMIGNIYLIKLESQAASDDVKENLEGLETLSFRASDMIKQLLAFARKGIINKMTVPLSHLMKESLKLQQINIPENIKLEHHICSQPLNVYADATQLQQVFINLMNNARDALATVQQPYIHIVLEKFKANDDFLKQYPQLKGHDFAHLSVCDNGCGIDDQYLLSIFEPFYTTKEVGKGTGLGLAMVFGTIESHQGVVDVESMLGKGTCFHIYLPLLHGDEVADSSRDTLNILQGHGESILLVDDNELMLTSSQKVLESLGYRVLTASNGLEAVELYERRNDDIDLIILDLVMPKMSGGDAAKAILNKFPDARIMFATAYDSCGNLAQEMASEHTLLAKPFSVEALSQSVVAELKRM